MASNSSAISRFPARKVVHTWLATLAIAGAVAFASAAAADPIEVALVENLTGNSPDVEFMDYVRPGQVIRLGSHQTIVLSYVSSCLRETITGGTVTIGTGWSEVQSGEVRRAKGPCDVGKAMLTGALSQIGGRTFRGGAR
jgi:hypothetical protein